MHTLLSLKFLRKKTRRLKFRILNLYANWQNFAPSDFSL